MIHGIFHEGSGLGNQLFRYVTTRVLAEDKGFQWGMVNPFLFKGASFMEIEMGTPTTMTSPIPTFFEKKIAENGVDIRGYDPEINFIEDGTIIDGEFQDQRYWGHRMKDIRRWLKVEPLEMPDDLCILGFRGGEYALYPDLFLTKDYWIQAMNIMRGENPSMKFHIVTDDPELAKTCFPHIEVSHEIGMDWRKIRFAKYLIISNSSFYIFPALLNQNVKKVVAPRYWARRNTKVWALPQNYYPEFSYI